MLNNLQIEGPAAATARPGENPHQSRDHDSIIIHSSSLSSPSSLIINEESPSSLSSVSSPQCSSSSSHSGRSSSSRSASPDMNAKKTSCCEELTEKSEISTASSPTFSTDHTTDHTEKEPGHQQDMDDYETHPEAKQADTIANFPRDKNNNTLVIDIKEEEEEATNKRDFTEISEEEEGEEVPAAKDSTGSEDKRKAAEIDEEVEDVDRENHMKPGDEPATEAKQKLHEPEQQYTHDRYEAMQPRLKKFLKIYQLSSKNSLGGPTVQNDIEHLKISKTDDESTSPGILNRDDLAVKVETSESNALNNPTSLIQPMNEHNNLSIIASVAAAAYFNQALSRQSLDLGSKLFSQEAAAKDKSLPSRNASAESPCYPHQNSQQQSYHHHQHHHPHKRAKYSSAFTRPAPAAGHNKERVGNKSNVNYLKCVQADTNTSPLIETLLHGERISCFVVGGEKRLCLHDILNTILKDFSVQQINSACQKLQIACLESSIKQLEILKKNKLLPTGAPNCGLLTQTNAERLCAYLMDSSLAHSVPPESPHQQATSPTGLAKQKLKVVHECFGKTYGHLHMNMYSRSDSACVECDTCHKLYTPKNFVCHSHRYESHTRHWGFDSGNWRAYLKLASGGAGMCVPTESAANKNGISGILSDIKVSNKDNIAANLGSEGGRKSAMHEEFENFKKKFLNKDESGASGGINLNNSSNGSGSISSIISSNAAQQMVDAMKRKMPENNNTPTGEFESKHTSKLFAHAYANSENSAKRLMTSSSSLNDLNNNLMKNASNGKSLNEHKLLNGLLSKPLAATHNSTGQSEQSNTNGNTYNNSHNSLLMPSNVNASLEHILKMNNKLNSQRSSSLTTTGNISGGNKQQQQHYEDMLNYSKSNSSILSLIGQQQSKVHQSPPKEALFAGNSRHLGSTSSSISSMEANMLEFILGEIESCVENKESVDRLRLMITQMHAYFNEKLNELQSNRSKLIAEFDEHKINYQTENEQLRCQLKLLQLHSDMNKDSHFQKPSPQQFQQQQQQQQAQLHQMKQHEVAAAAAAAASLSYKQLQANKTSPIQQQQQQHQQQQHQSMLSAQHHFQMLLQHQAMTQHKSNSDSLNAAAAVAAAQSFPQFFLNHYMPTLQQQQQHRSLAIDPSSSSSAQNKLNKHSSQTSFHSSPPMSHSSSTSPAKSHGSASLNLNTSHLHQTMA